MNKPEIRSVLARVRHVLNEVWDPISAGQPADEYDSYLGGIYRLLKDEADVDAIAEHLRHITHEQIGLTPCEWTRRRASEGAEALAKLRPL